MYTWVATAESLHLVPQWIVASMIIELLVDTPLSVTLCLGLVGALYSSYASLDTV